MSKMLTYGMIIMTSALLAGCGPQKAPDLQALEERAEATDMALVEKEDGRSFFDECMELERPDSAIEGVTLESVEDGQYLYVLGQEEESAQTAFRDYKVVLMLADYRVEDISGKGTAYSVQKDGKAVAECKIGYKDQGYAMLLSFAD